MSTSEPRDRLSPARARIPFRHGAIGIETVERRIVRLVYQFSGGADQNAVDWSSTMAIVKSNYPAPELRWSENGGRIAVRAGDLVLELDQTDGNVTARLQPDGENGAGALTAELEVTRQPDGDIVCAGRLHPESSVFGLGETTGFLDKRGEKYVLWNTDANVPHVPETPSLYQSIPVLYHFFKDGQAYGLFVDYPGRLTFDMRSQPDRFLVSAPAGRLDLYLIFGPSLKEAVSGYTRLTGRMELPPLWAIGYHQSRYSYTSAEQVLDIAHTFRRKRIPLDAIYLDIHYMDGFRVFTFDPERFAKPPELVAELAAMGVHAVPIVDPGIKIDPNYSVYREGVEKGYFLRKADGKMFVGKVWPGDSAFPDFTHPEVRRWWGNLHRFYTDLGIRGIWNDMNEPGIFDRESLTMDPDVIHDNDGHPKTHGELHNLYGLQMTRATYEALAEQLGGERPFIVSRAGYAGIQRYACVWTGDNRSYWEHLAMSVPMILNLGLSGVAFAGADIGGYGHHATGELLARWTQLGAFYPFCRNHNEIGRTDHEPWRFGERIEAICRRYIELRYRWMPHLYNLFREASLTGIPIWRPMALEYPHDKRARKLCDQFLLGADVLIAPILRPDTSYRAVYLPDGAWYDYWSGACMAGGRPVLAEAPLEIMPIYIRAGAILPETGVRQHAADTGEGDELTFRVYMPQRLEGWTELAYELYEDDGLTDAYKRGAYNVLRLELLVDEGRLRAACRYVYQGWRKIREEVTVRLIGMNRPARSGPNAGGHTLTVKNDEDAGVAEFRLTVAPDGRAGTGQVFAAEIIW